MGLGPSSVWLIHEAHRQNSKRVQGSDQGYFEETKYFFTTEINFCELIVLFSYTGMKIKKKQ